MLFASSFDDLREYHAVYCLALRESPSPQSKAKLRYQQLLSHTVRNLHFLSKNSTLISREKFSNCFGRKLVKMLRAVLDFLVVDNFDFTRKIAKKIWDEKLVKKIVKFCQN